MGPYITEETPESLARKCEEMREDDERTHFFRSIDKNQTPILELNCPAILVLANSVEAKELREELEDFVVEHLSYEKSHLVRKTCAYALKTIYFPADDSSVKEFFVLLASLEETQSHIVKPALEKLSILTNQIGKNNCPLEWRHLRAGFIIALRHNGWVQADTIIRIIGLPKNLVENDYDFLINHLYESLFQYDLYWRFEQLSGVERILSDLQMFVEQFHTSLFTSHVGIRHALGDFYVKFLDFIATHSSPSALFFISRCLPARTGDKLLNVDDLHLARRVLLTAEKIAFPKLRYNVLANFFALFVRVFDMECAQEFASLFDILPLKVQVLASQFLTDEFSETIKLPNKEITSPQVSRVYAAEEDLSSLLNSITTEDPSMFDSMKILVDLAPKIREDKREEIVEILEVAYFNAKNTSISVEYCKHYVDILLTVLDMNPSKCLDRFFALLGANTKNPQIAFVVSRQIRKHSQLSANIYPLLLELATYGEFPHRQEDVLRIAHQMARSFDLDEITEVHLLQKRTRELAVITLFSIVLQNMDTVGELVLSILKKFDEFDRSFKCRPFGLSLWHRKHTRLHSLLLLLIGKTEFFERLSGEINRRVQEMCISYIYKDTQQYSIKLSCEWILTFYCMKDPGAVASWILIILRSLQQTTEIIQTKEGFQPDDGNQRLSQFLLKTVPWITAQNFAVRIFALVSFKLICKWYRQQLSSDPALQFVLEICDFDVDVPGNSKRIVGDVCADPFFDLPPNQMNLFVSFYALPKIAGMPWDELLFEKAPEDEILRKYGLADSIDVDLTRPSVFSALSTTHVLKPERLNVTTNIQDDENVEIQQKLDTIGLKLGKKKRPEDCGLIVVASLVNKPTNLGGLSRTLEIFNGLSLVVSNSDVINKHEFKSLSMNSEKLLSIIEVKPEDLTDYFKQCKNSGFSIVAAEQTSRSTMLNNFRFPKKTVLLLGDERMGVPAELIRYVDHTVEIPQLGVTRSLNVHVSASLFIFEHAKQHLLSDH